MNQTDFLRVPQLRTIQTIITLQGAFIHFGEFNLFSNLWSCAVRISYQLGINRDIPSDHGTALQSQYRRRIFWSLIICDWLCSPLTYTCIDDDDFSVECPLPLDDIEVCLGRPMAPTSQPRHVQYMLVMCKICLVVRRFQKSLALKASLEQTVGKHDNELAEIIAELPSHLQTVMPTTDDTRDLSEQADWQRHNILMVLLYYRIVINRVLKENSPHHSTAHMRSVAICFDSAHGILDRSIHQDNTARQMIW